MPHRSRLAFGLLSLVVPLMALPACAGGGTPAPVRAAPSGHPATVPTPDLCRLITPAAAKAALHSRSARCTTAGGPSGFAARFTGTSDLEGVPRRATMIVSYESRYDAGSGMDRWASIGRAQGSRVTLFGVGEEAVFDAKAVSTPQLVTVKRGLIVAVALKMSSGPVPQTALPDHLLEVARQALAAASSPP
jgi:hypothetical protein